MNATETQQPATQPAPEKTWDEILDELNGKTYTLDGVHGTIKVERTPSRLHGGLPLLKVGAAGDHRGGAGPGEVKTHHRKENAPCH